MATVADPKVSRPAITVAAKNRFMFPPFPSRSGPSFPSGDR
jgi:hypothetical protein